MKLTVLILCALLQAMILSVGGGQNARPAWPGPSALKDKTATGIRFVPLNKDALNDALRQPEGMLRVGLMPVAQRASTQTASQKCPQLVIACPLYIVEQDTQLRFSALVAGRDPQSELAYTWKLSSGTINDGQGTASITVNTVGLAGRRIIATVKVNGLSRECQNTVSCDVEVARQRRARQQPDTGTEARQPEMMEVRPSDTAEVRPPEMMEVRPSDSTASTAAVRRLDVYGDLLFEAEKTRLAGFARQLRREPDAQGYIIVYGGQCSSETQARERAERAKEWLINRHEIDASRIVIIDGGYREKWTTEIFIGPIDAALPELTASVRPLDQSRCK
ncbi:MAG TPA: hypothetical protein VGX92_13015 [Pyrinomonadaceae bacterium]|nr:hypothetical protein [Pyrinomonadaceae bacterium]